MQPRRPITRDISYAYGAQTRGGRVVVRLMENTTGRLRLIKRAKGYEDEIAAGRDFWDVMVERYGLSLEIARGSLDAIPRTGPLVLVANHPYGILDGLMMGHILQSTRGDFRILANSVFKRAEEVNRIVLPISFDETKEAVALNIQTRKDALRYLADGGAIGVFPGGTVATSAKPFSQPLDPRWRSFTARMIQKSGATVVPIYFEGHTSRLFQIASHMHNTLRLGLLIKEFRKRVDTPVRVIVGDPICEDALAPYAKDGKAMMEFLRKATYELAPDAVPNPAALGYEFEERHR